MKVMKKIVTGMLVPFMMFSGIQVHAKTSDAVELKLANPLVNIQVKNEEGNLVNGSAFELYDSNNNKIASWESGNETNADCTEGVDNISGMNQIEMNEFCVDFEQILGKSILGAKSAKYCPIKPNAYYVSLLSGEKAEDGIKCKDTMLEYGCEYMLDISYYEDLPTEFTIPENKVQILNNSPNSTDVTFRLKKEEEGQDTITYMLPVEQSTLGTPADYTIPADDYDFCFIVSNSGTSNKYRLLNVSNKSVEYYKKKIHLANVRKGSFTEEGLMYLIEQHQEEFGQEAFPRGLNNLEDGRYVNYDFCFVSGSMLQLPEVDENGDVEIYVSRDTNTYTLYTSCSAASSWSGGGVITSREVYEEVDNLVFRTPQFEKEENGITLNGLAEGKYKIVQTGCSEKNLPTEDIYIDITNTGAMQKITVINKKKMEEEETTEATTEATTEVPKTEEPTEETTEATTEVPKTEEPTEATTEVPKTEEPTEATTEAPKTEKPTEATTEAPKTEKPTEATTEAPKTEKPTEATTEAPKTEKPTEATTEVPKTEKPTEATTGAPKTEKPTEATTEAPKTEKPTEATTGAPKTEKPTEATTEAPKTEKPTEATTEAPKTEKPTEATTGAPKTEKPTEATAQALKQETTTENITIKQMENIIFSTNFDEKDCKLSQFEKLKLRIKTKKKGSKYSVELSWKKIQGADGYIVYGAKCGKKNKMKKIKTIENGSTNEWNQTNRKKGTYYKYIIVAYKGDDIITASPSVHATTPGGKKGNPVGITNVKKTKLTMKPGDTYNIKAKVKSNKKYSIHVAELRYESENKDIASVDKKGVIKANKAGETEIYLYTQNGIYKKIKVKVK